MRFPLAFVVLALVLALASCVGPRPTRAEIEAADCGEKPVNYDATVRAYFDATLRDPESARYQISEPVKGCLTGGALSSAPGRNFAWRVPVLVNAKNGFGGYTGWEAWQFYMRGEEVVYIYEGNARDD